MKRTGHQRLDRYSSRQWHWMQVEIAYQRMVRSWHAAKEALQAAANSDTHRRAQRLSESAPQMAASWATRADREAIPPVALGDETSAIAVSASNPARQQAAEGASSGTVHGVLTVERSDLAGVSQ